MKLQIVVLRDIKTDAHTVPQFIAHIEAWRRALGDAINNPGPETANLEFVKHPEDFEAYHLGEWDDNTAAFHLEHDAGTFHPERLFLLSELVRPK